MDILDNIIFANLNRPLTGNRPIQSDFVHQAFADYLSNPGFILNRDPVTSEWNYLNQNKMFYTSFADLEIIKTSSVQHWNNIDAGNIYIDVPTNVTLSDFTNSSSPYHLIFSYLIENTRILHIFEKVISRYLHDEELGIADGEAFQQVFQWIMNSERLFFKPDQSAAYSTRSLIRPSAESSRRNAYYRMFGMDLAFPDNAGQQNPYYKAKASNQQFILLFERLLSEVWRAYINVQNTSGANETDLENLTDIAQKLQELLLARRGSSRQYSQQNLSYEEYTSVFALTWFAFVLSYDSPVVSFLGCNSNTFGERLQKIGEKVGVPAHGKSQALFEMAQPCQGILRAIESGGVLDNSGFVVLMLNSLRATPPAGVEETHMAYMRYFLSAINNWEKATGHKIKNPEANITGTVKVQQNGARVQPALN